jgi:hypothetical protein
VGLLFRHLIVIGIAVALEPMQIVSFIGVLTSSASRRAGWGFMVGWVASIIGASAVAVLAAQALLGFGSGSLHRSDVRLGISVLQLGIGIALFCVGLVRIRRKRVPCERPPSWLARRLEHLTVAQAAVIGALIPPWPLVGAGAVAIMRADVSKRLSLIAVVTFWLVSASSLLIMQLFALLRPMTADRQLASLRRWLERHANQIMTVLALVVGVWLILHSARGLSHQI